MANIKLFSEEIESKIANFSYKNKIFFAWLCAVRALPYLGERPNFDYWKEDVYIHLMAVFGALDAITTVIKFTDFESVSYTGLRNAARNACRNGAHFAADAVYAVSDAAYATYTNDRNTADETYKASAKAAEYAYLASNKNAAFKEILLDSLYSIEQGAKHINNDISVYGYMWQDFLSSLHNIGCRYWANLYKCLFESGFKIDSHELERRVSAPVSRREKGAKELGEWLDYVSAHTKNTPMTIADPDLSNRPNQKIIKKVMLAVATDIEITSALTALRKLGVPTAVLINNQTYITCSLSNSTIYLIKCQAGSGGVGGSALTVFEAIADTDPDYVIMGGIAFGSNKEKQNIGDILVSSQVWEYDPEKLNEDETIIYP